MRRALATVALLGALTGPPAGGQLKLVRETLFAAGWQGGGVYRIDVKKGVVAERAKTALYNNFFLAWSGSRNELYVAADNGGAIVILEPGPLRQVALIKEGVGWNAMSLAVSRDGARLFATFATRPGPAGGTASTRLAAFDLETRALVKSVALADEPESARLALSPGGDAVYVARDGAIEVYDAASLERVRRVETEEAGPFMAAVSPDGGSLYTAGTVRGQGEAARRDAGELGPPTKRYGPAHAIAVSRDGAYVWILSGRDVVECDASLEELRTIRLPDVAIDVEESFDGQRLFVLTLQPGAQRPTQICVVDRASGSVIRRFAGPPDVRDLLVAPVPVKGPNPKAN